MLKMIVGASKISPPSWITWDGSRDGAITTINNTAGIFGMCKLSADKSVILYDDSSDGLMYLVIVTTDGTNVVNNTATRESLDPGAMFGATMCLLDATRVLVCYTVLDGSTYALVASIDGNNITIGTPKLIAATNSLNSLLIIKMATDQCLLVYADSNTISTTSATVITVTGTTVDNPHAILNIAPYAAYIQVVPLTSTTAFLALTASDSAVGVDGVILTIAANVVTKSTNVPLTTNTIDSLFAQNIDATHVLCVYDDTDNNVTKSLVVTIAGSSITPSVEAALDQRALINNAQYFSTSGLIKIDAGTFMFLFSNGSLAYGCVIGINGTTAMPGNSVVLFAPRYYDSFGDLLDAKRILTASTDAINSPQSYKLQVLSI